LHPLPDRVWISVPHSKKWRVFGDRLFRGIYGPKRDKVTWGWKQLNSEELHKLWSSSNIITVFESSRISYMGHGHVWERC
jgi:hypothetical protein